MRLRLTVNGAPREVDVAPETPLLWVLRDELRLTGTKYGCGIGACGACTVHVEGRLARACSLPASAERGSQSPRSQSMVNTKSALAKNGSIGTLPLSTSVTT